MVIKASEATAEIPAETRWAIATQSLTGAIMASYKVMLDTVGREKYDEILNQVWTEAGGASKQVADALGLAGTDAKSVAEILRFLPMVQMGPEFECEVVEESEERAVYRWTSCPYWNRAQELGISDDLCSVGDPAYCNGLAKALNPNISATLAKSMPRGDQYCELVLTLQK